MTQTIKQAIASCRGDIFVILDEDYSNRIAPFRVKVSKPIARKVVDYADKDYPPTAHWEGDNLLLLPNAVPE